MGSLSWSIAEARKNLAEIINRVAYSDEEVIIEKHGKPVVKIISLKNNHISDNLLREFSGIWKGKVWADDLGRKGRYFRGRRTDL